MMTYRTILASLSSSNYIADGKFFYLLGVIALLHRFDLLRAAVRAVSLFSSSSARVVVAANFASRDGQVDFLRSRN